MVLFWPCKYLCEQERSKIREKHWVWLWHRLWCQRCGFTLCPARACLCDLEPVTFTSVPTAPICYSWFQPFFWSIRCMGLGQIWGKKELFNSTWRSECLGDVVIVENYGNLSLGGHLQNLYSALHTVLGLLESALSCCNANNGLHSASSSSNFLWISPANLYLNKQ